MLNWAFKKIVKVREKVALDLGETDQEKPFLEHLDDLRTMLMRMAITLIAMVIVTFCFYPQLLAIIEAPLVIAGVRDKISLQNLRVTGGFMTAMNISLVAAVILSFPLLLYYLLQFILPGLHNKEKKVIFPALAVGAGLFMMGVVFAYYVVSPRALGFFYTFSVEMDQLSTTQGGVTTVDKLIWDRVEYVKFLCQFILIFGACFELPVVVMALVKMDVLNYKMMKTSRTWAAIIICIIAAIITPTQDALTLGLLAVPMYILYEICIWLAYWLDKRDRALHPEYYADLDKADSELSVKDDWDNENYNPWGGNDEDEDDEFKKTPISRSPEPVTPHEASSQDKEKADDESSETASAEVPEVPDTHTDRVESLDSNGDNTLPSDLLDEEEEQRRRGSNMD